MGKVSFGPKVAGILLAAGASTRMGTLKQLLPVAGMPLVENALSAALKSRLDCLVLVLGHRAGEVEDALGPVKSDSRIVIVYNPNYRQGLSSSLVAGLENVPQSQDHAMILLGDMPSVGRGTIDQLIESYLESRMPIGAVKVGNRAGHPVVFRRDLFSELKALTGDMGARALLEKYSDQICFIAPEMGYDHRDIDTAEDYQKFQRDMKERKTEWPIS